jgi:hypothetical protein
LFSFQDDPLTGLDANGRTAAGAVVGGGGTSSRSTITLGRVAATTRLSAARTRPKVLGTAIFQASVGGTARLFSDLPLAHAEVADGGHGRFVAAAPPLCSAQLKLIV